MFRSETNGGELMDYMDIKISRSTWELIRIRVTELTVKTGKLVTIKEYIKGLVEKDTKGKS